MNLINPVFYREMLLLRCKTFRLGYLFSSLLLPLLYLGAFGWGLGGKVRLDGGSYAAYLVPGLLAMTAMTNAFNLPASSLGMGRLYSGSARTLLTAPLRPRQLVNGFLLAGMVRGLLGCTLVALAALLLFGPGIMSVNLFTAAGLLATLAFFSLAGFLTGLLVKDMEDVAVITNLVIMPMAFFSGTFFPLDGVPPPLRLLLRLLPLSQINLLMRAGSLSGEVLVGLVVLSCSCAALYLLALALLHRYQE